MIVKRNVINIQIALLLLIVSLLSGCAVVQPAASILVEVDVYKGPLSKPIRIQLAELDGIVEDTKRSLRDFKNLQEKILTRSCYAYANKLYANDLDRTDPDLDLTRSDFYMAPRELNCPLIYSLYLNAKGLISELDKNNSEKELDKNNSKKLIELKDEGLKDELSKLSRIAAQMKVQSVQTSAELIAFVSSSERVRIAQNAFSNVTSEYGNLILSRTNDLMIQIDGQDNSGPISRRNLHLNTFLADSTTTQTPRLHEWYNSKVPVGIEEWKFFLPGYNVSMTDRIRIYERMFDDTYWSNVNTVYASGLGDVSMALIRDDIGNWNLKNFDNDPTELLGAYKDLTLEGIKAASKLMAAGASGGSTEAVQAAFSMANQLTTPLNASSPPNLPIKKLRTDVLNQINTIKAEAMSDWGATWKCNTEPVALNDAYTKAQGELKTVEEDLITKKNNLKSTTEFLKQKRQESDKLKTELNIATITDSEKTTKEKSKQTIDNQISELANYEVKINLEIIETQQTVDNKREALKTAETKKTEKNQFCKKMLHETNNKIKIILRDYRTMLSTMEEMSSLKN